MGLSVNMNKNGIKAHQLALDAISNNIANATTEGYKAKGVRFRTLMNNPITEDDVLSNFDGAAISAGATSEVAVTSFASGSLKGARLELNVATNANNFFAVENNAGDTYLTKDGSFTVDGTGRLVNSNGHYLSMNGTLPQNMTGNQLSISKEGILSANTENGVVALGQINVYAVANPEILQPIGENYFVDPTNALTLAETPAIQSRTLEQSNVDLAQELTNMIVAQRAYSLNIKVSQSTDEMMSNINQFSV